MANDDIPDLAKPPMTHAQTMRAIMSWALMGAGIASTALAALLVVVLWMGEWSPETQVQRLDYLGYALLGALGGMGLVIVSMAIGGPVGRISAKTSVGEFHAEGDKEDDR